MCVYFYMTDYEDYEPNKYLYGEKHGDKKGFLRNDTWESTFMFYAISILTTF